jgi:hypothetical protein
MTMSEKEKDSNELLNILMIIIGLLFIFKAILDALAFFNILVPEWMNTIASEAEAAASSAALFGTQGIVSGALGFWCLVAGIGLFREEEYALGMGLVVLSIMALMSGSIIFGWIGNPASFDATYWPNYITIVAFIVGVLGFFWLLFTRKRYD